MMGKIGRNCSAFDPKNLILRLSNNTRKRILSDFEMYEEFTANSFESIYKRLFSYLHITKKMQITLKIVSRL